MNNAPNLNRGRQYGFSLLEILVAFSILAIFLGVLLNIFSSGLRGAEATGQYVKAVQIAESLLASVGHDVELRAMTMDGESDEIYHWRIAIEPFVPPVRNWQPETLPLLPLYVTVTVTWPGVLKQREYSLSSLRLANNVPATASESR